MKNGKLLLTLVLTGMILIFTSCRETPANPDGYINISGVVQNVDGTVINSAKVEAVDATDKIIATDLTDLHGIFSLSNIPANDDNVFLVVTKTGYKTLKVSVKSLLENALDNKIVLILEKEGQNTDCCGNIHFVFLDKESRAPLKGVEVKLSQEAKLITHAVSGENGKVDFQELCPGNYWVRIYKDGYAIIEKQITIANCDPINMTLILVKNNEDPCCGIVNMMIFDKVSKQGIGEVKVVLNFGDQVIETKYTDSRGVVGFTGLCMGKYWISIERTGYKKIIEDFNVINCDPLNITFAMEKANNTDCCGKIYVKLYDKTNEKRLGGRQVTLYSGNVAIAKQVTNDNGEAAFTELCPGGYVIKVAAEGYKTLAYEVKVINCDPIQIALGLEPNSNTDCCGKIHFIIYDSSTQKPIAGAEIKITSADGKVLTQKTNESGFAGFGELCMGKYNIRIAREGYKVIEQTVNVENCDPIAITVVMQKTGDTDCCGKISFSLYDNSTKKPIAGAEIKLTSSDGKVIIQKTSDYGVASFSELCMGTYYVRIAREGYKVVEITVKVENCDPIQKSIGMELVSHTDCCKGVLYIKVLDKTTQAPIQGATVRLIKDGKVLEGVATNAEGYAVFDGICEGEYAVSITREGYQEFEYKYTHPCDQTIKETKYLTKIDQNDCCKGILAVIVTDQATQKPIVGAIVKLWLNGKEVRSVKTNEQGYVLMDGLCDVEYGVSINAEGYKGIEYKYTHPCNEKVYQNKTLAKTDQNECCKGVLKVTILDNDTKKPIVGAYLKLTQYGKIITYAKANESGLAVIEGICEADYVVYVLAEGYNTLEFKHSHPCNKVMEFTKYLVKKEGSCTGKLKLQYLDSITRRPVANAEVKLYLNGVKIGVTTTNSDGYAAFEALCTGKYVVNASHEGYAIKEADYSVTNGQTTTDVLEFIPVK